jgi:hypothetical protein
MSSVQMLRAHPGQVKGDLDRLASCLSACSECAEACSTCADACLEELQAELVECIRLNLDCADVCDTTAKLLTRQTSRGVRVARKMLETCVLATRVCAVECEAHASRHEHCRVCAEVCRRCERLCQELLDRPTSPP